VLQRLDADIVASVLERYHLGRFLSGWVWAKIMRENSLWLLSTTLLFLAISTVRSEAADSWGAFTVCCLDGICGNACGGAASTGFGSGPTQDAAKAGSYQQAISDVNSSLAWKWSLWGPA
jgi:hypothetical protein